MLHIFLNSLNYINIISVTVRLLLAVLLGGIIGIEREANRHPAGFRTHILVCVGACTAMMTNLYIFENIATNGDPARMGAQVITGVGFLGAGTILIAGRRIIGLTTAAGLWASACLGLAIGSGFYEGALLSGLIILFVLAFLPKLEKKIYENAFAVHLHIEMDAAEKFKSFNDYLEQNSIQSFDTYVSKSPSIIPGGISFRISIRIPKKLKRKELIDILHNAQGVYIVEEL